jgi:hypothetical protein
MGSTVTASIDMDLCRKGINEKMEVTRRTLPEILEQTGANIVSRTVEGLPPFNVDVKRMQVSRYLKEPLATRVKLATSGKRKGHFIKKGARNKQLQRVHLIVQMRRRKAGLRGLYGKEMMRGAGKFKQRSSVSVGYSKSMYMPIADALNDLVRFKIPSRRLFSKIARWDGSAGRGQVTLPTPSDRPQLILQIASAQHNTQSDSKLLTIETKALQLAVDLEGREASRWAAERLAEKMK